MDGVVSFAILVVISVSHVFAGLHRNTQRLYSRSLTVLLMILHGVTQSLTRLNLAELK